MKTEDTMDRLIAAAKELAVLGGHEEGVAHLCKAAGRVATHPPMFAGVMKISLGDSEASEAKEAEGGSPEAPGEPSISSRIATCLAISQVADRLRRKGFEDEASCLYTIAALSAKSRASEARAALEPISRAPLDEVEREPAAPGMDCDCIDEEGDAPCRVHGDGPGGIPYTSWPAPAEIVITEDEVAI